MPAANLIASSARTSEGSARATCSVLPRRTSGRTSVAPDERFVDIPRQRLGVEGCHVDGRDAELPTCAHRDRIGLARPWRSRCPTSGSASRRAASNAPRASWAGRTPSSTRRWANPVRGGCAVAMTRGAALRLASVGGCRMRVGGTGAVIACDMRHSWPLEAAVIAVSTAPRPVVDHPRPAQVLTPS